MSYSAFSEKDKFGSPLLKERRKHILNAQFQSISDVLRMKKDLVKRVGDAEAQCVQC